MNKTKFFAFSLFGILGSCLFSQSNFNLNPSESIFQPKNHWELKAKESSELLESNKKSNILLANSSYTSGASSANENDEDRGRLYYREAFLKGSIKTGLRYFNTQSTVQNAEVTLFEESEIFNSSFNFFRRTNTPIVAAQAEYMILDGIGVGGFAGFSASTNDATDSDIVTTKRELTSWVVGGFISHVQPIENWLYVGQELNISYETGVLKVREEDNSKKDFNFSRISANIDLSAVFAPTERVQVSVGGISVGYNSFDFTGSGENSLIDTEDEEPTNTFKDNKVEGTDFGLRATPKLSVFFTVFTPGGR